MKVVCAYCNRVLREGITKESPISHSICQDCVTRCLSKLGVDISKYLDMFNAPVILVNQDTRVLEASNEAVRFLQKPVDQIIDTLTGSAIDCTFAGLPGGCGKTDRCPGCVLRETILKTYETGEPVDQYPVILSQGVADQMHPINLLISTRKIGTVIMVKIESGNDGQ